jgi:hypothetical protein
MAVEVGAWSCSPVEVPGGVAGPVPISTLLIPSMICLGVEVALKKT